MCNRVINCFTGPPTEQGDAAQCNKHNATVSSDTCNGSLHRNLDVIPHYHEITLSQEEFTILKLKNFTFNSCGTKSHGLDAAYIRNNLPLSTCFNKRSANRSAALFSGAQARMKLESIRVCTCEWQRTQ